MSGLQDAAAAKVLSTQFATPTNLKLYREVRRIYQTHTYSRNRQFTIKIPSDCTKIKVTATGAGSCSGGGFIGGGSSGGGSPGYWLEDYELTVFPEETLYCQVGGSQSPSAAGAPPSDIAAGGGDTYIRRGNHGGVSLINLRGGLRFSVAVPTATQGGQAQIVASSSLYGPATTQPAAGAAGIQGGSMAQFPTANTGSMVPTYPPLTPMSQNSLGNYGTNPGSGGGVNAGVGQNGGAMGRFLFQQHFAPYAAVGGSGATAAGGMPGIALLPEKYEPLIRRDAAINAFVNPNAGALAITVDTPVQKMWGAGAVGAASGHTGGYGGDGVLIIDFVTGLSDAELDYELRMPTGLVDTATFPAGKLVPNTFLGRHGWYSAVDLASGRLPQQITLINVGGFLQIRTSPGNTFYNNKVGDTMRINGIGAAGANLTGRVTALLKFNVGDAFNTLATTDIPVTSVAVAVGTATQYASVTLPVAPTWNWSVLRSHDNGFDWNKMHIARLQMTTTSGSNALTFVSSVNNSIAEVVRMRNDYISGAGNQGTPIAPLLELSGTGIPVGTRISNIDGSNNITMDQNATASATVTVYVYDITRIETYLASPMATGKRMMFTCSGTPTWLASPTAIATNRSITSNVVTITHAALPAALQAGVKILVRNCPNAAVNGSNPSGTNTFVVLSGGSTTSTRFTVPTTANEGSVADTTTEIILAANGGFYGYMNPPNPSVGAGWGELTVFVTWLMTKYGSVIDWIESLNEAHTGRSHNTGALNYTQAQQGIWYTGTFDDIGNHTRLINLAAKAVKPSVKVVAPSTTGVSLGQRWFSAGNRSSAHFMLAAGDGATGKLIDWVDVLSFHVYEQLTDKRKTNWFHSLIDLLRYYRELYMMESINKPNLEMMMNEGGFENGAAYTTLLSQPAEWQKNELIKQMILYASYCSGFYPHYQFGDPERITAHREAMEWCTTYLQGKTIHPDSCFNEDTGEMYFKNTDGYEIYLP